MIKLGEPLINFMDERIKWRPRKILQNVWVCTIYNLSSFTSVGPLLDNCTHMGICTWSPDIPPWGSTALSFHSLCSLSISSMSFWASLARQFHQPVYPHAVLTAPLEWSTRPNQWRLLSLKMRSRSPRSSSFASGSLDLTVAISYGLILQICLIMAVTARTEGFPWSTPTFHRHIIPHAGAVHMATELVRN